MKKLKKEREIFKVPKMFKILFQLEEYGKTEYF